MEIKKFTRLSLLLALSIILNIVESFFPILNGMIPGLKIGLANIVILVILYTFTMKDALEISILRVLLVGMMRTGFGLPFLFSLGGSILSVLSMGIAKKFTNLSILGVSLIGSIFHMIGQIGIAMICLNLPKLAYYIPILFFFAIPTGLLVGYISRYILNHFEKELKYS